MDKELKSFDKTVRQFRKLAKKTDSKNLKPKARPRLIRAVLVTTFAVSVLGVTIPPFRVPVSGAVTSGFFLRKKPEALLPIALEVHNGIDFGAPAGTKVFSTAPGVVRAVGYSDTFGNYVIVRHLPQVESYYAHLSKVSVKKGDVVLLRSVRSIGTVGSTGRATGPHLHFETRLFGKALPPRLLLVFHGIRKAILGF